MKTKTAAEIASLAKSARMLRDILTQVCAAVKPGVTGIEVAKLAEELIKKAGGVSAFIGYGKPPYPSALCVSVNSCVVHGIPSAYRFRSGDIVGLDIGMIYEGLYTDMARTVAIEPISEKERLLVATAKEALDKALQTIAPGVTTGDIGFIVQSFVESRGFGVVRDLAGHGVGHRLHEPPEVPNFGGRGDGTELVPGMVLALEPMITLGGWEVETAPDRWSVMTVDGSKAAHFEDMVVVTDAGHTILTR
ncbi:MAG: type I methionyl aminopeptidase [Candidatus Komeilibacteria bacterium]|nr:type I methionyl aminopeptidase [Candidatus Komeilibacteria bacterium]